MCSSGRQSHDLVNTFTHRSSSPGPRSTERAGLAGPFGFRGFGQVRSGPTSQPHVRSSRVVPIRHRDVSREPVEGPPYIHNRKALAGARGSEQRPAQPRRRRRAAPAGAGRPCDTINTLFRWGRVGSTGDAPLGLQAEAPSHLVKRWQNCNWQASASPSRLRVATSTASSPRRWRLGAANRGATLLTSIRKAKTIGWPLRAPALDRAVEARTRYQLSL